MFTKFWDKLAEGLAGTWNARILAPALAFWGGGLIAWSWKNGWATVVNLVNQADAVHGVSAAIVGLFLLTVSSGLVEWVTLPVLRFAEGYWPRLLSGLRYGLSARLGRRLESKEERWQVLARDQQAGRLDPRELEEYARLDVELAKYPVASHLLLPTRLGNLLRAAEEYPYLRYGLEITVIWPRLWLVLPESTRKDVISARQALDERAQIMTWGLLFAVWSVWAWWAVLVALVVALVAYRGMSNAAGVYGELLRATFDLHRFTMYKTLNWPLPDSVCGERADGLVLTQYLHRGLPGAVRKFKSS